MGIIEYAIVAIVFTFIIGTGVFGYRFERRDWNSGKCLSHGVPWQHFDNDSQGGRGYKCGDGCRTWISYPGIDTTTSGLNPLS